MSKTTKRTNNKNKNEQFIQFSQKQLDELIQSKIDLAIKPLQDKICDLNNVVKKLRKSVVIVCESHEEIPKEYSKITRINTQQKKDIKLINKRAAELRKKTKMTKPN